MSLAFFYLLGQNGTYLASSLYGGVWTTFTIVLIALIVSAFNWQAVAAIIFGWLSVVYIPEHRLNTTTKTFVCHETPKTHHHSIFFITEVFMFVCITGLVNIDDSAFWLWLIAAPLHCFYVLLIDALNRYSHRIREGEFLGRAYYLVYVVILLVSDLYFMLISVIVVDRSQNLAAVAILAAFTFIFSYVTENFDFAHRFEFMLIDKQHVFSNTSSNKGVPAVSPKSSSPLQSSSNSEDASRRVLEDQV